MLRSEVIQDIHKVFKTVWSYRVPEEVNEILFCTDHEEWGLKKKVDKKHPAIEAFAKVNANVELLDLQEAIKQLKLV